MFISNTEKELIEFETKKYDIPDNIANEVKLDLREVIYLFIYNM